LLPINEFTVHYAYLVRSKRFTNKTQYWIERLRMTSRQPYWRPKPILSGPLPDKKYDWGKYIGLPFSRFGPACGSWSLFLYYITTFSCCNEFAWLLATSEKTLYSCYEHDCSHGYSELGESRLCARDCLCSSWRHTHIDIMSILPSSFVAMKGWVWTVKKETLLAEE